MEQEYKVFRICPEHHQKIKKLSAEEDRTMTEIVNEVLEKFFEKKETNIKVVRVSPEHHRKIKRLSVEKGRTMTEIVEEALEDLLEKSRGEQ